MNYKHTLLIPKSSFEMRGNLINKEPKIQKEWESQNIYNKLLKQNKNNKNSFILHDGPPYANGNLHVGHALNKIIKDFIVRFNNSIRIYSPLICGWDTHGLPIELAVYKNKKNKIKEKNIIEKRELFKQYALLQVEKQIDQFKRLGIFSDFNNKYITLDPKYQIEQLELFLLMIKKKIVYYDLKPIYWSPSSNSALADAEIEYQTLKSPSIYVDFTVLKGNEFIEKGIKILIWTTTPWTIPSNLLLAVNKDVEYMIFSYNNQKYLVASNLVSKLCNQFNWKNIKELKTVKGNQLLKIITKHPLYEKTSEIVLGHHVTIESGTGIVHIAPGFGVDDFLIGKENNVEIFSPINNYGKFTSKINDKDLEGLFYDDANKIVINKLVKNNKLIKLSFINHRYPIDWRTKKPVIYRATYQWFINLSKIKQDLLKEINNISWKPNWAKRKMMDMINGRTDWCISRQRIWGVPIIAFFDENNKPRIDEDVIKYVINIIKKNGINSWFEKDADFFLLDKYKNKNWKKESDIMDVWFDSATSNLYMKNHFNLSFPFDLYFEGMDQFRGWFNSSLITSIIANKKAPYKKVLTHGFVNDEKGFKMSKSRGNIIDPLKICNQIGADVLRLWVLSVNYLDDVRVGNNLLATTKDYYRKIRNTLKFIVGNLFDFNPSLVVNNLEEVDQYILIKLKEFEEKALDFYKNFNFNKLFLLILNFISSTLSTFYLDFTKDILYILKADSIRRRQVQSVFYYILNTLINVLRPVLIHTIEELYTSLPWKKDLKSIHLGYWDELKIVKNEKLNTKWNNILLFKEDVNKCIESSKNQKLLSKSFEAVIYVYLKDQWKEVKTIKNLEQIFIVNKIIFVNDFKGLEEFKTSFLKIKKRIGKKCLRCWKIVDVLYNNNEICMPCFNILELK